MKKISIIFLVFVQSFIAMANDGTTLLERTKDKDPISKGMFLHIGFGFPTMTAVNSPQIVGTMGTNSLGTQFNLEAGNQWYFVNTSKLGFGIKISWVQLGFSSSKFAGYLVNSFHLDTRILKFGPMLTAALGDNAAVDFSVELNPLYIASFTPNDGDNSINGFFRGSLGLGVSPGLRLRYGKYILGGEVAFARVNTTTSQNNTDVKFDSEANYFCPRVFFGFKF